MLRAIERVLAPLHQVTISGSSREALAARGDGRPAPRDSRHPHAGARWLRAHGAAQGAASGHRRHPDDRQRRRSGREAAFGPSAAPRSTSSRSRSIVRCCGRWSIAASSCAISATTNRRHVARLEQELAAARAFQQGLLPGRDAVLARRSARLSPDAVVGARRRPVRLRPRPLRPNGAARGRRRRPWRVGGDADRRREVRVPGLGSRRLPSGGRDGPGARRRWAPSASSGSSH